MIASSTNNQDVRRYDQGIKADSDAEIGVHEEACRPEERRGLCLAAKCTPGEPRDSRSGQRHKRQDQNIRP